MVIMPIELRIYSYADKWLINISEPINIKTTPPIISATVLYLLPKILPIFNPTSDSSKVTTPKINAATKIFTSANERDTPTARASMLIAIDKANIFLAE